MPHQLPISRLIRNHAPFYVIVFLAVVLFHVDVEHVFFVDSVGYFLAAVFFALADGAGAEGGLAFVAEAGEDLVLFILKLPGIGNRQFLFFFLD